MYSILKSKVNVRELCSTSKILRLSVQCFSSATEAGKGNSHLSLYAWGTSQEGSIPISDVSKITSGSILSSSKTVIDNPVKIDLRNALKDQGDDSHLDIRDIVCGPASTAIILSDNKAYTFGSNNKSGLLGHGDTQNVLVPKLLYPPDSTPLHYDQISKIAMGSCFSAIIDINGDLYTCGYNGSQMNEGSGCLGHGYLQDPYVTIPTLVQSLVEDGCKVDQVAVGDAHMTVLTTEGEVLSCGGGSFGRLGNLDPEDQFFLEPIELLAGETDIIQIAGGKNFTLALTKREGIVYAWGKNDKGQCGTGQGMAVDMYAMEPMPAVVEGLLEGQKVVKIAAGHTHAAAITDKGELFVWGMGQDHMPRWIPTSKKVIDVVCGLDYSMILQEDGRLYSFGKGGNTGVLGLASTKKAPEPTLVEGLLNKNVRRISAGWKHAACLVEE